VAQAARTGKTNMVKILLRHAGKYIDAKGVPDDRAAFEQGINQAINIAMHKHFCDTATLLIAFAYKYFD